jgi:hypothetical protein
MWDRQKSKHAHALLARLPQLADSTSIPTRGSRDIRWLLLVKIYLKGRLRNSPNTLLFPLRWGLRRRPTKTNLFIKCFLKCLRGGVHRDSGSGDRLQLAQHAPWHTHHSVSLPVLESVHIRRPVHRRQSTVSAQATLSSIADRADSRPTAFGTFRLNHEPQFPPHYQVMMFPISPSSDLPRAWSPNCTSVSHRPSDKTTPGIS